MSNTLYLIQSEYAQTEAMLDQLEQIYAIDDAVVLMGDAVLAFDSAQLLNKASVYALENDAEILPKQDLTGLKIIDYAEFSDLVLSFKRCISLK